MINSTKLIVKPFVSLISIVLLSSLASGNVYAGDPAPIGIPICNPPLGIFAKIRALGDKSIEETVDNASTSAVLYSYKVATGSDMRQTIGCANYAARESNLSNSILSVATSCIIPDEATICPSLFNQFGAGTQEAASLNSQIASSQIGGSLLGLLYTAQNTLQYEPLPVNMAYFFNDYGRRLPIVGDQVFAQVDIYRQPFLNQIYSLWAIVRNIAYGLMSVVIMVVGIMLIMRKKIGQQIVVNIQYALPKLALTLIFITFSYPIGAAIAGISWALYNSARTIILSIAAQSGLEIGADFLANQFGVGLIFAAFLLSFMLLGVGIAGGVGAIIVIIIAVVLYFAVLVKAFFIYLKMLVQIISAPFQFVFGAIPGNDDQTVNWFKRMIAYGLSIFLMQLTVQFVNLIVAQLLFDEAYKNGFLSDILFGSLYVIFGLPLLFLFGIGFAFKVPTLVENAIMGAPKRR